MAATCGRGRRPTSNTWGARRPAEPAALLAGFLSRWVAIPLGLDMLAALYLFHLPRGFFVGEGGVELALLLLAGLVTLTLNGSGALSLDGLLGGARAAGVRASQPMRPAAASGHD